MEKNGATQSKYGRYLPHFVLVRSAMIPIIGSETASQIRVTSTNTPASINDRPKMFE